MNILRHCLYSLVFFALSCAALPARESGGILERFAFQGQSYSLCADFQPSRAGLLLMQGKTVRDLSSGLAGESILLGTRAGAENVYVFWVQYRNKTLRLAFYNLVRGSRQVLNLEDFRFFALPEAIEANGELQALVFLANRDGNDDVFHYDLGAKALTPVTRTTYSEKKFSVRPGSDGLVIETHSLRNRCVYRFDEHLRRSELVEEAVLAARPPRTKAALTPEQYNTYVGFGDSITEGWFNGILQPEKCYLAKMGEILDETYGPNWSINLGIGGTQTYEGAERVEVDLDQNPAFYFILMYGVNDVWRTSFSLESSLESLEFMIDAALNRGMRVIASTLTPRKDSYAGYEYYWDQLYALSAGIVGLAKRKGTAYIETLDAFMNTDPPNGWKTLLEDIIPDISKGNHPNEEGHQLIASLLARVLADFPPQSPGHVAVLPSSTQLSKTVAWDANPESDFSHYHIDFDFFSPQLKYSLTTAASQHVFQLFPFVSDLYLRVQAIDRGGRESGFTVLGAADGTATEKTTKTREREARKK